MGLKEGGVRGSLRNVSTGVPAIPDSVLYQYPAEDFATPWPDQVGSADMTVNGLTQSTFSNGETSVAGDGSSDHGLASGPESLPANETFGIAFTPAWSGASDFDTFFGARDSDNDGFVLWDIGGSISVYLEDDNGNDLQLGTNSAFDDGSPKAVVINKHGNGANDIDIYVDDMQSAQPYSVDSNQAFDHTAWPSLNDMAFYTRDNDGSLLGYIDADVGIFEFNSEPYTEQERTAFVDRRPEV